MAAPPPPPRVPTDVLRGLCHEVGAAREAVARLRAGTTSAQDLLRARVALLVAMQAYVSALTANHLPVPPLLRDELRLHTELQQLREHDGRRAP